MQSLTIHAQESLKKLEQIRLLIELSKLPHSKSLIYAGKKELDDGDVDAFNRRIRLWEREQERLEVDEEKPKYQQLDGEYKIPKEMWDKLYKSVLPY